MSQIAWYYLRGDTPVGPCTTPELWALQSAGAIHDETVVWRAGMATWQPFRLAVPPIPSIQVGSQDRTKQSDIEVRNSKGNPTEPASSKEHDASAGNRSSDENGITKPLGTREPLARRFLGATGKVAIFLVTVIAMAIGGLIGKAVAQIPSRVTESKMEQTLQSEKSPAHKLYTTIKNHFPEDYKTLVMNLTRISNSGRSLADIRAQSAMETSRIRKKYAAQLAHSPDTNLQKILLTVIDLHKTVLAKEGATKCNKYAKEGPRALSVELYASKLADQGSELFLAMSVAITAPVLRKEPTDSDWELVFGRMKELGAPDNFFELLANEDIASQDYCPAIISFVSAARSLGGEPGPRIRADLVKKLAQE